MDNLALFCTPDVIDDSGFRFFYTLKEPAKRAGIFILGHAITQAMIVPPYTENYTVAGICSLQCSERVCINIVITYVYYSGY